MKLEMQRDVVSSYGSFQGLDIVYDIDVRTGAAWVADGLAVELDEVPGELRAAMPTTAGRCGDCGEIFPCPTVLASDEAVKRELEHPTPPPPPTSAATPSPIAA